MPIAGMMASHPANSGAGKTMTRDDCLALDAADPLSARPRAFRAARGRELSRRQFARRAAEGRRGARRAGDRNRMGRRPDPLVERGRLVRVAGARRRQARAAARRRAAPGHRHRHDLGQSLQAAGRRGAHAARARRPSWPSAAIFPPTITSSTASRACSGSSAALRAGGGDRRPRSTKTPRWSSSATSTIAPPRSRTWRRSRAPRTPRAR